MTWRTDRQCSVELSDENRNGESSYQGTPEAGAVEPLSTYESSERQLKRQEKAESATRDCGFPQDVRLESAARI